MLAWTRLHAYVAVHVGRVSEPLDRQRLEQAVSDVLNQAGISHLSLDKGWRSCSFNGDQASQGQAEIRILDGQVAPQKVLDAEIQSQINVSLVQKGLFIPVRFFAVDCGQEFYLGVAYAHFVSDALGIARILRAVVACYCGRGDCPPIHVNLCPRRTVSWMSMLKHLPYWMATWPGHWLSLLRGCKPAYRKPITPDNGFEHARVDAEGLRKLVSAARSWDVKVNDVLMAAMLKCVMPHALRRMRRWRNRVLVSSIVNCREDFQAAEDDLGLFLGSFMIRHGAFENTSLEQLSRDVNGQTAAIKKHKISLRSLLDLRTVGRVMPLFSPPRQQRFYREYYPLWGGMSNVNLDSIWPRQSCASMADYFRAVSTGPLCPLVFSVTTYNGGINIGGSYRTSVFSPQQAADMMALFTKCIADPTKS